MKCTAFLFTQKITDYLIHIVVLRIEPLLEFFRNKSYDMHLKLTFHLFSLKFSLRPAEKLFSLKEPAKLSVPANRHTTIP